MLYGCFMVIDMRKLAHYLTCSDDRMASCVAVATDNCSRHSSNFCCSCGVILLSILLSTSSRGTTVRNFALRASNTELLPGSSSNLFWKPNVLTFYQRLVVAQWHKMNTIWYLTVFNYLPGWPKNREIDQGIKVLCPGENTITIEQQQEP